MKVASMQESIFDIPLLIAGPVTVGLQCAFAVGGLPVAGVFETHSDVSAIVSREASELSALYRDASSYPEPTRT